MNETFEVFSAIPGWAFGLVACLAAPVIWYVIHLEQWKRGVLTRKEHDRICKERQEVLKEDIAEIRTLLKEQDVRSQEHRQAMNAYMQSIAGKLGYMTRAIDERMPTGDTGINRRVSDG